MALILSRDALEGELGQTVLWGRNMERRLARTLDEARLQVADRRPDIIVVDHRFPEAPAAVAQLRQDGRTRAVSIVALARGDFDASEIELIQAGVNAILRLPPDLDWDDRLIRLIHVPLRRSVRLSVRLVTEDSGEAAAQVVPVVALNLSVNGMLVESERAFRIGEDVQFAFRLPGSPQVVIGSGTVVRQSDGRHFGIELTHVQGDGRVRIKRFVESGDD
ncbi:MAG TPA: PilZ domain-containing protein [Vicinamibacteria bacterium]|nr:PilZ domain-containing protein [Vicinamibacteria bacterium]